MSKTPQFDSKIKEILDSLEPGERTCALTGEKWNLDDREISWYKKFNVPSHPWSPLTRMKQLVGFFEMYQFWYHQHPETKKQFVSFVHPVTKIPTLPDTEWFDHDYLGTTIEHDPAKPFFDQFHKLQLKVPLPANRYMVKPEGSIAMGSFGDINSYFMMACQSRDSFYCTDGMGLERAAEVSAGSKIIDSYHVLQSHRIHGCHFIHGCYDCMESAFLFDCRDCQNCFGATNKRHGKYLWFNEQLSKEEWEKRRAEVDYSCRTSLKKYQDQFKDLMESEAIWPENFNEKCENVLGEYMINATDCKYVFAGVDGNFSDLHQVTYLAGDVNSSAYCGGLYDASECYMNNIAKSCAKTKFSWNVANCQNVEYSSFLYECENCFGCLGLRHKKFCIFNKQYSEEEYWAKLDEIKCAMLDRGEYGQFFPASSFYSYCPDNGLIIYLAQNEAGKYGAPEFDPEAEGAIGDIDQTALRKSSEVPDCISDIKDEEWANVPLLDESMGRRFSYLKPELDFYRKNKVPAPTEHFIKRVFDLFLEQNSALFEEKKCASCQTDAVVAKNATYPNKKVYCRKCYLDYLEKHG
jgi:hypothetical protein